MANIVDMCGIFIPRSSAYHIVFVVIFFIFYLFIFFNSNMVIFVIFVVGYILDACVKSRETIQIYWCPHAWTEKHVNMVKRGLFFAVEGIKQGTHLDV